MRVTTAPGERTPKALPGVTPEQIATHDGAADPCACVACVRARDVQALVNRLREAGETDWIAKVIEVGARHADPGKLAELAGYVVEIVAGKIKKVDDPNGPVTFPKLAER